MYGNYFMCRPDKLADVLAVTREGYQSTILINSVYAEKITDEELEKAKRRVFVEILQHENQNDISQAIGNNLMYYDRRVCRSELAERVSSVSKEDLQKVVREVMVDGKVQVTIWGNVDAVRLNGRKIELA
jgi:predicted Zn-dependent peptidase